LFSNSIAYPDRRDCLPQEAGHLVVARADAAQQALDAAAGVRDAEHLLDPNADLFGAAKAPRADLLLEALDLCGGEVPRSPR
jgi:hypothetical protein